MRYDIHFNSENVSYIFTKQESAREILIDGVRTIGEHRRKGLASFLMNQVELENEGNILKIKAEPFKDEGMDVKQLIAFYTRLGYKAIDGDNILYKDLGY